MNVLNKKIAKKLYGNSILDALQLVIPAVILTADDLWCENLHHTGTCTKYRYCPKWRTWFSTEWESIRAAAEQWREDIECRK